ncbi:MAG TPA: glycine zipper 2TM domain-containing protein [Smithellaceae bacterium]|nr:glycine zipper 2TM domain-containing protein [Smithellaceae bacterium]
MINEIFQKTNCLAKYWTKFLLLLAILLLSSCYYYPHEQVMTQPPQDQNITVITQIYFYPNKGQSTEQQSRDHYACYNWAVDQTGFDPSASSIIPEQRVRVVPMPPPGQDTIIMSIAGAVLGALIGGPHHAAQGAIIGAAGGAMAGAVSDISRQEAARQLEEAYANGNQARNVHKEKKALEFRRAMSACLEGRGYTVK